MNCTILKSLFQTKANFKDAFHGIRVCVTSMTKKSTEMTADVSFTPPSKTFLKQASHYYSNTSIIHKLHAASLAALDCLRALRARTGRFWKRQAPSPVRTVFWIERHCLRLLSSRSAARTTNTPNKRGDGGKSLSLRAGDKTACLCCGFITPQPRQ